MITIYTNKINTLNQNNYDLFISSINLNTIPCSCNHHGCLIKHGYYKRTVKSLPFSKVKLSILRVKCNICNKTHAIMPSDIIPYSSITVSDTISIICDFENDVKSYSIMDTKPIIDESNISYIVSNYRKYWQQRLITSNISLSESIFEITLKCFDYFSRAFMQIKKVTNSFIC